ncbi:MAG: hypothetical protein DWQ02_08375 [Bacteroidetes bacterium]|nr:MAG: hypothetical protein DWQ02_08375 [Bacteroidota bacterium]
MENDTIYMIYGLQQFAGLIYFWIKRGEFNVSGFKWTLLWSLFIWAFPAIGLMVLYGRANR